MTAVTERIGRLVRGIVSGALLAAVALGVAGRLDLPMLNLFLAGLVVVAIVGSMILDSDRLRERLRWKQQGEDAARLLAIRLLVAMEFVIALLDVGRIHASDSVPFGLQVSSLVVALVGASWTIWAIAVNRFFVPVIRVQPERGHQVVSLGPYARVRHPGYAGMIAMLPASALGLGSWWATIPAIAAAALFVRRAAHEDRFLSEHLEGYRQYAQRVPFRLLPGMWALVLIGGLAPPPDVQLDGGAYVGRSEASEDLTLFLGLTVRR